jgi:hypothetical protein
MRLRCWPSPTLCSSDGAGDAAMSAMGPGRAKTFFLPEKLHATGGGPRRHDRLSMFLLLRVCSQAWRNLGPR